MARQCTPTLDVSGLLEVSGPIRARHITAGSLTVHSGGTLSHPSTASSAESLSVTVTGDVTVEDGGSIERLGPWLPLKHDLSWRLRARRTLGQPPGRGLAPRVQAEGHAGSTYGSVTGPQEAGGGGVTTLH